MLSRRNAGREKVWRIAHLEGKFIVKNAQWGMGGGTVDPTKRVTKKKSTSRSERIKISVRESELLCAVEKPTRTRDRNICRAVLLEYIICEDN